MSIRVDFYNFSKKEKSTAQPAAAQLVASERCNLKAPTDLLRPTLLLDIASTPTNRTYAYIPEFGRYYFVDKWRNINAGQWECDLIEDYLATWKASIGAASKYVLRSASRSDGYIVDTIYPAKSRRRQIECLASGTSPFILANASIVLGIIGSGTNSMAGIQYYSFTPAQLASLMTAVFDSNTYSTSMEITADLQKMIFNPMQYVSSAMLFPFYTSAYGTQVNTVRFGWWDIPQAATLLPSTPSAIINAPNYTIAKHPQAASRGDYLNGEPYSSYYMTYPGFGVFDLPAGQMIDGNELTCLIYVDLISGRALLRATVQDNGTPLRQLSPQFGQIGVPIELAQIGRDVSIAKMPIEGLGVFYQGLGAAVKAVSGGRWGSVASGIGDAIRADAVKVQSQGTTGSLAEYMSTYAIPRMYLMYSDIVDRDLDEFGAPLCKIVQISTLSGYVQCADGELDIAGIGDERAVLAEYLTGGFFYE